MQLFNFNQSVNFMRLKWPALLLSALLVLGSFGSFVTKGMNWGLDFTGGTVIEVGFSEAADLNAMRKTLAEAGYADAVIQLFGSSTDVLIRIPLRAVVAQEKVGEAVLQALNAEQASEVELRRVEFVGPSVGEELKQDGGLALL
ncbi:MAG: protein translocase subunit SecF, partial [Arsukibacterium sp.]|nr:protein translocase subunit SecF [Arsukibacterium sp.]